MDFPHCFPFCSSPFFLYCSLLCWGSFAERRNDLRGRHNSQQHSFPLFLDRVPGKIVVVVVGNIFDCSNRRSKVQNRPAPMEKSIYKTRQGCTVRTICGVENITIGGKAGLNIRWCTQAPPFIDFSEFVTLYVSEMFCSSLVFGL